MSNTAPDFDLRGYSLEDLLIAIRDRADVAGLRITVAPAGQPDPELARCRDELADTRALIGSRETELADRRGRVAELERALDKSYAETATAKGQLRESEQHRTEGLEREAGYRREVAALNELLAGVRDELDSADTLNGELVQAVDHHRARARRIAGIAREHRAEARRLAEALEANDGLADELEDARELAEQATQYQADRNLTQSELDSIAELVGISPDAPYDHVRQAVGAAVEAAATVPDLNARLEELRRLEARFAAAPADTVDEPPAPADPPQSSAPAAPQVSPRPAVDLPAAWSSDKTDAARRGNRLLIVDVLKRAYCADPAGGWLGSRAIAAELDVTPNQVAPHIRAMLSDDTIDHNDLKGPASGYRVGYRWRQALDRQREHHADAVIDVLEPDQAAAAIREQDGRVSRETPVDLEDGVASEHDYPVTPLEPPTVESITAKREELEQDGTLDAIRDSLRPVIPEPAPDTPDPELVVANELTGRERRLAEAEARLENGETHGTTPTRDPDSLEARILELLTEHAGTSAEVARRLGERHPAVGQAMRELRAAGELEHTGALRVGLNVYRTPTAEEAPDEAPQQ